jgi:hypothetical protein
MVEFCAMLKMAMARGSNLRLGVAMSMAVTLRGTDEYPTSSVLAGIFWRRPCYKSVALTKIDHRLVFKAATAEVGAAGRGRGR